MDGADVGRKVKTEGDADGAATTIKQAECATNRPELLFAREDYLDFLDLGRLPKKAGVPGDMLQTLIVKELVDNALDSCDRADRPGAVEVSVDGGCLVVSDEGTGIHKTPQALATDVYCVKRPMVSSKLLRKASRGAIGNGLRVVLGWITATQGMLVVETGRHRVTLKPERTGETRIIAAEDIGPVQGTRVMVIAGEQQFGPEHLVWATDAIELAQRSGEPAFKRKPSGHWFDLVTFHDLLMTADGNPNVREFLDYFDGCAASTVRSQIAANFHRRPIKSIESREEAALLLGKVRALTQPLAAKLLRPLGRDAIECDGYRMVEGVYTDGAHLPTAQIPFIVEVWCNADYPSPDKPRFGGRLYMNRTKALTRYDGQLTGFGRIELAIGNAHAMPSVPAGPCYTIDIAITAPYFIALNDGKEPDCRPFAHAISEAITKAARNKFARDIASQMTAHDRAVANNYARYQRRREDEAVAAQRIREREERQRVKEERERAIAARKAKPTIEQAVRQLLPQAIKDASQDGLPFNTRHLLYDIRERVRQLSGETLKQAYFDQLITRMEAETGELHPNLIREARGNIYLPRVDEPIPLGTLNVRRFERLPWTFSGLMVVEKDDLALILKKSGFCERHDCAVMSSKGFNTRASRDLIDKIAETDEPVRVFSIHDADAAGSLIQHTLQHETKARGARKCEIIDLGLQPWEGMALGLQVEAVEKIYNKDGTLRARPVAAYIKQRTDTAPTGETWEQWLQHSRVELNAMKPMEFREWLDDKMDEYGSGKVIPPGDILKRKFAELTYPRVADDVDEAIQSHYHDLVTVIQAEDDAATGEVRAEIDRITADLRAQKEALSAPFQARIKAAKEEVAAIDREAMIWEIIESMIPEDMHMTIDGTFTETPELHWTTALKQIADDTEVKEINLIGVIEGKVNGE